MILLYKFTFLFLLLYDFDILTLFPTILLHPLNFLAFTYFNSLPINLHSCHLWEVTVLSFSILMPLGFCFCFSCLIWWAIASSPIELNTSVDTQISFLKSDNYFLVSIFNSLHDTLWGLLLHLHVFSLILIISPVLLFGGMGTGVPPPSLCTESKLQSWDSPLSLTPPIGCNGSVVCLSVFSVFSFYLITALCQRLLLPFSNLLKEKPVVFLLSSASSISACSDIFNPLKTTNSFSWEEEWDWHFLLWHSWPQDLDRQ